MPISGRLYPRSKGDASQPGSAGRHISGDACARHVDGQPGGAASRWGNRPGAMEAQELGLLRGIVSRTAQGDHAARTLDSAFLPGRGGGDGGGASALRSVSAERLSRVRAGLGGRVWQMARPQVRGRDPARARAQPGGHMLRCHRAEARTLPHGAMFRTGGSDFLVVDGAARPYAPEGYGQPVALPEGRVDVLTAPPMCAVLLTGYRPRLHPSASGQVAAQRADRTDAPGVPPPAG